MKKLLTLFILCFLSSITWAQGTPGLFEIKAEKEVSTGAILVVLTPLSATSIEMGDFLSDITFYMAWPTSYGSQIDLNGATVTSSFGIALQPTKGQFTDAGVNKYCRSFGRNGAPAIEITSNWAVGVPVTLLSVKPFLNGTANQVGDFEIANIPGLTNAGPAGLVELFPNVGMYKGGNAEDFYPAVTGFAPAVPLPIELISFDATAKTESIELAWKSINEIKFKGFDLERSLDGKNFERITFIASKGAIKGNQYVYDDKDVSKGVTYYYRLKMMDNDGRFKYSAIKNATLKSTGELNVYPNPSFGDVSLAFSLDEDVSTPIDIFDMAGKRVLHKDIDTKKGKNLISLSLIDLPSGMYSIHVYANQKVETKVLRLAK